MSRLSRASIATRLLLASLLLILLALPLSGVALAYHFRLSVTEAFDERLDALLKVVLASVAYDPLEQVLQFDSTLGDPRFEQVFSGWYWQVSDGDSQVVTSRSLWDQRLPVTDQRQISVRDERGPRDSRLRVIERDIRLAGIDAPLHVSVALERDELDAEIRRFEQLLAAALLGLGVLLLLALAAQIRWGLAPLRRMRGNLQRVEAGDIERLDTALPAELAQLAGAMNAVLDRDRRLIERSRHTAGNLAHALKTPLSVLRLKVASLPKETREPLLIELARIDAAVRHHLARASAAGDSGWLGSVKVAETLAPLLDGLTRLAQRRGLVLESDIPASLALSMEAQDLQELVGNLLDNALRWAERRVTLRIACDADQHRLQVSDDGPGMSTEQRSEALMRGSRLDERRSGSGLGLSIVADLVALYGGQLALKQASPHGLRVEVTLPATPHAIRDPR
nr:ATP-binding protein [Halomonas socia]